MSHQSTSGSTVSWFMFIVHAGGVQCCSWTIHEGWRLVPPCLFSHFQNIPHVTWNNVQTAVESQRRWLHTSCSPGQQGENFLQCIIYSYLWYTNVSLQSDLVDEREVSAAEGQQLARQYHCSYMETSALRRINIDEAFHEAARIAKSTRIRTLEREQTLKEHQRRQGKKGCCTIL